MDARSAFGFDRKLQDARIVRLSYQE